MELKTDGEVLIIRPCKSKRDAQIRSSVDRMLAVCEKSLKKLAK